MLEIVVWLVFGEERRGLMLEMKHITQHPSLKSLQRPGPSETCLPLPGHAAGIESLHRSGLVLGRGAGIRHCHLHQTVWSACEYASVFFCSCCTNQLLGFRSPQKSGATVATSCCPTVCLHKRDEMWFMRCDRLLKLMPGLLKFLNRGALWNIMACYLPITP